VILKTDLKCPVCNTKLQEIKGGRTFHCEKCMTPYSLILFGSHLRLAPAGQASTHIQYDNPAEVSLAVKKIKTEIINLEAELKELSAVGSPLDTVRTIGFSVITLGLVYSVLNGAPDSSTFSFAAIGILLGIVLHGGTEFFGKDYYIRKAYLNELIKRKRQELVKYQGL
jgi:hypothetical protein